jgi:hypothetical protein
VVWISNSLIASVIDTYNKRQSVKARRLREIMVEV